MADTRTNSGDTRQAAMAAIATELERPPSPSANKIMQACGVAGEELRAVGNSIVDTARSVANSGSALAGAMADDLELRGIGYVDELERLRSATRQVEAALAQAVDQFATVRMKGDNGGRSKHS